MKFKREWSFLFFVFIFYKFIVYNFEELVIFDRDFNFVIIFVLFENVEFNIVLIGCDVFF